MVKKKFSELTRDQLREELRKRGLPVGGSKPELAIRLENTFKNSGLDVENFEFEVAENVGSGDLENDENTGDAPAIDMGGMLQMLTDALAKNSEHLITAMDQKLEQNKNAIEEKFEQNKNAMEEKLEQNKAEIFDGLRETVDVEIKRQIEPIQHQVEEFGRQWKIIEERLQRLEGNPTVSMVVVPPGVAFFSSASNEGNIPVTEPLKTKVKIPTFDGEISWELYKSQFEIAARLNRWDDKTKAGNLIVSLRGAALQLLSNIAEKDKEDYQKLIEVFEQRFGQAHLAPIRRRELKNRRQNRGESLQAFSSEVLKLTQQAYPEATVLAIEQTALEAFIDGIFDWDVQSQVRIARCKTLKEALSFALEVEAARRASRRPGSAVLKQTKAGPIRDKRRCYHCDEEGHIKPNCPKWKSLQNKEGNFDLGLPRANQPQDQAERPEK